MTNAPASYLVPLTEFEKNGFAVIRHIVSPVEIDQLNNAVAAARSAQNTPGLRNLLKRSTEIKSFASSGVAYQIARTVLGVDPVPVRAILFDKTPETNWYVTWHQDLSIPVRNKVEVEGYGPWSNKDGIVHVQPPASILEKMVSLRIHLDDCSEANGAIKFIAGSHLAGALEPDQIGRWRDDQIPVACSAQRGDVIAMRPLILHSSSASESPEHRRVLHLEYAGTTLPAGMEWGEA